MNSAGAKALCHPEQPCHLRSATGRKKRYQVLCSSPWNGVMNCWCRLTENYIFLRKCLLKFVISLDVPNPMCFFKLLCALREQAYAGLISCLSSYLLNFFFSRIILCGEGEHRGIRSHSGGVHWAPEVKLIWLGIVSKVFPLCFTALWKKKIIFFCANEKSSSCNPLWRKAWMRDCCQSLCSATLPEWGLKQL